MCQTTPARSYQTFLRVRSESVIAPLQPGDLVVQYRPDNGRRGPLRVIAAVTVARYVPKGES